MPCSGVIRWWAFSRFTKQAREAIRQGLARTFQIVKPFATKSVLYNVMVGAFATTDKTDQAREKALTVLDTLNFTDKKETKAGNLTIADRKRLEIARALATEPRLLLLDEVMAGLRPAEVDEVVAVIRHIQGQPDCGRLYSLSLSDRGYVLEHGRVAMEGAADPLLADPHIKEAYLGI